MVDRIQKGLLGINSVIMGVPWVDPIEKILCPEPGQVDDGEVMLCFPPQLLAVTRERCHLGLRGPCPGGHRGMFPVV